MSLSISLIIIIWISGIVIQKRRYTDYGLAIEWRQIFTKKTQKKSLSRHPNGHRLRLYAVKGYPKSTFIRTETGYDRRMGKHTGLSFCEALGGLKPSFSTFILTVNRFLRPFRDITRTLYEDRAETLLAIIDAAAASIVVLAPPVSV